MNVFYSPLTTPIKPHIGGTSKEFAFQDSNVGFSASALYHIWNTSTSADESMEAVCLLNHILTFSEDVKFATIVQNLSRNEIRSLRQLLCG